MSQLIDKLTYDEAADAAYIGLVGTVEDERLTTMTLPERPIHLDFNEEGQIVGVEVLNASYYIPKKILKKAVKI